jgi:hypothetical protein
MSRLTKRDLEGYSGLTMWLVLSDGEAPSAYGTRDEAVASAKEQAEETPGLVLGLYKLEHYVSARVQSPALFDPEPKP